MIGQYPLIPTDAFLFIPSNESMMEERKSKRQRIIFGGGVEYSEQELEKIVSFKNYVKNKDKHQFVLDFPDDTLLRFLQATSFHNDPCLKALIEYHSWQLKTLPLQITSEIQNILQAGILYISGRDYSFRPIIVVNVGTILRLKMNEKTLMNVLGYFFQYAIENCLIQGQIQTWISIIDLNYEGIFTIGGALMNIISFLSSNFRVRSHHSYLMKCPGAMKLLWGMVKKVLNEDQIRKLTFSDKATLKPEVFDLINPLQIEEKYGGSLPNITQYWPICPNEHEYSTKSQKAKIILPEQYDDLFNKGQLLNRKIKKSLIKKYMAKMQEEMIENDKNTEKDDHSSKEQELSFQFPQEKCPITIEFQMPAPFSFFDTVLKK